MTLAMLIGLPALVITGAFLWGLRAKRMVYAPLMVAAVTVMCRQTIALIDDSVYGTDVARYAAAGTLLLGMVCTGILSLLHLCKPRRRR